MNDWLLEQRIMKCCAKLSQGASEILWKVTEAYGADSVIKWVIFVLEYEFRGGREVLKDHGRSGRQIPYRTEESMEQVRKLFGTGSLLNIWIRVEELNVDRRPEEGLNFGFMLWSWVITLSPVHDALASGVFRQKSRIMKLKNSQYSPHLVAYIIGCCQI